MNSETGPSDLGKAVPTPKAKVSWQRRLGSLLAKLAVLSVSCAIALLGLEWGIRKFLPYFDPRNQIIYKRNDEGILLGVPSATFHHGTAKGDFFITISFNKYGFWDDKDFAQAKTNDVFVVGDSQSFGWGVEVTNRFSSQLQQKLSVPVYNISMVMNDFRGYERLVDFAQRHGAPIRNLIIGVCMENDLVDYTQPEPPSDPDAASAGSLKHRVIDWTRKHSAVYVCASFVLEKHEFFRNLFERLGIARSVEQMTGINTDDPKILQSSRDELLKLARRFNTVVLIIPSRALWYGKNQKVEEQVHVKFVELLRQAGVRVVDMKPILEKTGDPLGCYHQHDPHWRAKAHVAAGEALYDCLKSADEWQFLFPPKAAPGQ